MAQVLPFRGIRYNPSVVGELDAVIAPPYDVISPALQEELHRRSAYNVVHMDLAREVADKYARAADLFRTWLQAGVLTAEPVPSLYYAEEAYRGEFGEPKLRKGFFARVRIEDPDSGVYRPHERTLAGPKADRLALTRACRANLSPIFSLYDDPEQRVLAPLEEAARGEAPLLEVTSHEGVPTRLWRVADPQVAAAVASAMADKSFFIADGHHRYETALNYRNEQRAAAAGWSGAEPWNYTLMYLSNLRGEGLTVFPTHRAVFGLGGGVLEALESGLGEHFEVRDLTAGGLEGLQAAQRQARGSAHAFGLVSGGGADLRLLTLRDPGVMHRLLDGRADPVLHTLDVTILHTLLLEGLLKIDERAQEEQSNLRYVKSAAELLERVRSGEFQLGFFLNPTRVDEVKAVAERGERMPQKSTFFFPKLPTGLLLNPLYELPEEASG